MLRFYATTPSEEHRKFAARITRDYDHFIVSFQKNLEVILIVKKKESENFYSETFFDIYAFRIHEVTNIHEQRHQKTSCVSIYKFSYMQFRLEITQSWTCVKKLEYTRMMRCKKTVFNDNNFRASTFYKNNSQRLTKIYNQIPE